MNYTYLALGDSYTIGEGVLLSESFPYQTVQLLRQTAVGATSRRQGNAKKPVSGWQFTAPEIIAKTGWTTDELDEVLQQTTFLPQYDIVSLLIGVNNQYRGRTAAAFTNEFTSLLQKAIVFAGNNPAKVFVLSIPDWGVTPFAEGRNRAQIWKEIDDFNTVCKTVSAAFLCNYIEITSSQRVEGATQAFLAGDGLHPSGKEYASWAEKLKEAIIPGLI